MPKTLEELTELIANRDGISYNEAAIAVKECARELSYAFMDGNIDEVEEIIKDCLGLEPDYLDLFIF